MKTLLKTAVLTGLTLSCFAQAETLRVATDGSYPPFAEINSKGEMVGFDIDIANALCEQLKMTCEIKQIAWDGLIPALKTKKIDAIVASMNATDARRKNVTFTEPYYKNPGLFVRRKGSDIELTEQGLKGKVIGVLQNTVSDRYATDKYGKWATIKRYTSQDDANLDAQNGRIDVLLADKLVMDDGFLNRPIGKDFEAFGPTLNDPQYFGTGISIAVRKGDQKLADRLSQAIKAIRQNGVYTKINAKYFDHDIYGDDDTATASDKHESQ